MSAPRTIESAYEEGRMAEAAADRAGGQWYNEEDELFTELAAFSAARAVTAVEQGDLDWALECAQQACRLEAQEYGDCPTWRPLLHAIRSAREGEKAASRR
jgi:hypothetical protein